MSQVIENVELVKHVKVHLVIVFLMMHVLVLVVILVNFVIQSRMENVSVCNHDRNI